MTRNERLLLLSLARLTSRVLAVIPALPSFIVKSDQAVELRNARATLDQLIEAVERETVSLSRPQ